MLHWSFNSQLKKSYDCGWQLCRLSLNKKGIILESSAGRIFQLTTDQGSELNEERKLFEAPTPASLDKDSSTTTLIRK